MIRAIFLAALALGACHHQPEGFVLVERHYAPPPAPPRPESRTAREAVDPGFGALRRDLRAMVNSAASGNH